MEYLPKWIGATEFIAMCRIDEATLTDLAVNHDFPLYWDHSLERIDPESRLIKTGLHDRMVVNMGRARAFAREHPGLLTIFDTPASNTMSDTENDGKTDISRDPAAADLPTDLAKTENPEMTNLIRLVVHATSFVYKRFAENGEAPQRRDLYDFIHNFSKEGQFYITREDCRKIVEALCELNITKGH